MVRNLVFYACSFVSSLLLAQVPISNVYSGLNDEEFTVSGIVTTPEFGISPEVLFFIQDGSRGLLISYEGNECTTTQGDEVLITGLRKEVNNMVLLEVVTLERITSNNQLPSHQLISDTDLSLSSSLIGNRVTINNVTITDNSNWPEVQSEVSRSIPITTGTTDFTLTVDRASYYNGTPVPCNSFSLSGVLAKFDDEIQILPFYENELDPLPKLTVDQEVINFGQIQVDEFSLPELLKYSASNLVEDIVITTSGNFEISENETDGYTN